MRLDSLNDMAVYLSEHLNDHSVYIRYNHLFHTVEFVFIEAVSSVEAIYGIREEDIARWNDEGVIGDQLKSIAMETINKIKDRYATE